MLSPTLLAAILLAIPTASATSHPAPKNNTAHVTRCSIIYEIQPLPTGTNGPPTWYKFTKTTNTISVQLTVRDTITITPNSTTSIAALTTTVTLTNTTTSTPPPTTIPAGPGFIPLLTSRPSLLPTPSPVSPSRVRRTLLGRTTSPNPFFRSKRQSGAAALGQSHGFQVNEDGSVSELYDLPHRVECRVYVSVNETVTGTVTGVPATVTAGVVVATSWRVVTRTEVDVVTVVVPRATAYAACGGDNVVNQFKDIYDPPLYFQRVIYRPKEGFPIANEVVVNTTSAENCCIACQNTPFCAGSFYVPSQPTTPCHLRLTQPPSSPPGYPTLPGNLTSTAPPPSSTVNSTHSLIPHPYNSSSSSTCGSGSASLYLGVIEGRESFPKHLALSFSNGPCGRLAVNPVPLEDEDKDGAEDAEPTPVWPRLRIRGQGF